MGRGEAYLRISMETISCTFILSPGTRTPSTIYKGFGWCKDDNPLIMIGGVASGAPEFLMPSTPAALPCNASVTLVAGRSLLATPFTYATEPDTAFRFP